MRSHGSLKKSECPVTPAPRPGCMSCRIPADRPVNDSRLSPAYFHSRDLGPSSIGSARTMTATENEQIHCGEIEGVSIDFPMVVPSMHQATLSFTVPIEPARAVVPGEAFDVLETAPGSATFIVALVDYVENPWGDYNEVNLGLIATPVGRPELAGAFVYRMPV